jgi:enoyl-CoA hydratase/carnithine racemase
MTSPTRAPQVEATVNAGIMELVLNRPEKKNALTRKMYRSLAEALVTAGCEDSVRVVLLRGAGDCFCSGNDVTDFQVSRDPDRKSPSRAFLDLISGLEKPLIAAVQGAAVGIGTTMLLHCDLVYASENATFQVPFVNLGLCPEGGSSFLLPRMIGHRRAFELLLLGQPISSATAENCGLVNRVYGEADLIKEALGHACRLAGHPRESVMLTKRLLKQSYHATVSQTIISEGRHFARRLQSKEFQDAVSAFLSRRKPNAG